MCDDPRAHGHGGAAVLDGPDRPPYRTRRSFLATGASAAAGALLLGNGNTAAAARELPQHVPPGLTRPGRLADFTREAVGTPAFSMAMHVHGSSSEEEGSVDSQLFQASSNGLDVLWWTDHDGRLGGGDEGSGYRQTVHFLGFTDPAPSVPAGQGKPWTWLKVHNTPDNVNCSAAFVTNPVTPNDPGGGSLQVSAQATSGQRKAGLPGSFGVEANTQAAGWNIRMNIWEQVLTVDVLALPGWTEADGYQEMLIASSYHQAYGGFPGGDYDISYRFVPGTGAPGYGYQVIAGVVTGIVTVPLGGPGGGGVTLTPAASGGWVTAACTPSLDIPGLFPAIPDPRDFALWNLTFNAVSYTAAIVAGCFGFLRFTRPLSGADLFAQQASIGATLGALPQYAGVVQQYGVEWSGYLPHANGYGPALQTVPGLAIPSYEGVTSAKKYLVLLASVIATALGNGMAVSYNHPFGYSSGPALPQSAQDSLLATVAASLLPSGGKPAALGCTILEVGYNLRSGVDLAHHVALWDVMSRNAVFLTANATNDDHHGQNWYGDVNNWFTAAWAASSGQSDLLTALAAGRVWLASLSGGFAGPLAWLDLLVDGFAPMGSATVSTALTRQLSVIAAGIPAGGSVQVLQGAVDYAGTSGLASNATVIASYPDTAFAGGSVTMPVSTSADSYVRTQVLAADGVTIVGLSNPVWLLQNVPPNGIPAARMA